jgi:hypothetical protein
MACKGSGVRIPVPPQMKPGIETGEAIRGCIASEINYRSDTAPIDCLVAQSVLHLLASIDKAPD